MKLSRKKDRGASLTECLTVMLTLGIGMLGMIKFRYHCVNQVEYSKHLSTAVRCGQGIAEIWKSQMGSDTFDLSDFAMNNGFSVSGVSGRDVSMPPMYNMLDQYDIVIQGDEYLAVLGYQDSEDTPGIRNLYVSLSWTDTQGNEQDYTVVTMMQRDSFDSDENGYQNLNR